METRYVVVCVSFDDTVPVAVCETEEDALQVEQDGYAEDYCEELPTAGDRMRVPFEQFVREHPGRYKHYETVYISKEE